MPLSLVRLTLARDEEFPEGSATRGYEFIAPLDEKGHIDADLWRKYKTRCRVRRFWEGEPDEEGHLVHRRGGTWAFHYESQDTGEEDEPGYKFDSHVFAVGEYVSLREPDGDLRTFRVDSVRRFVTPD